MKVLIIIFGLVFGPNESEKEILEHHWSEMPITYRIYVRKPIRFYVDTTIAKEAVVWIHPEGEFLWMGYDDGIVFLKNGNRTKVFINPQL